MRISPPPGRRKSRAPIVLVILVVVIVAFLIWLSTRSREVPTQRIEQDVTNAALAH
jgi:O-antigen ligase